MRNDAFLNHSPSNAWPVCANGLSERSTLFMISTTNQLSAASLTPTPEDVRVTQTVRYRLAAPRTKAT